MIPPTPTPTPPTRHTAETADTPQYVVSGRHFTMTFLLLAIQSGVCVLAVWGVKRAGIISCERSLRSIVLGGPHVPQRKGSHSTLSPAQLAASPFGLLPLGAGVIADTR